MFKLTEDLSAWQNKSGIYIYTRLEEKEGKPYFEIIYIGCTLNFSHVKYTSGSAITRHKPTHICFYPNNDKPGIRDIAESLIDYYKPRAMGGEVVDIREGASVS